MLLFLLPGLLLSIYVIFPCLKLRNGARRQAFGLLGRLNCLDCRSLLPKSHEASFVELFFVVLNGHEALDRFLLLVADVGRHLGETHIFPDLLLLLEDGLVDDVLDILGIFGVHPHVDLFVGQNHRHPVMHFCELRRGILCEDDDFVVVSVEPCH